LLSLTVSLKSFFGVCWMAILEPIMLEPIVIVLVWLLFDKVWITVKGELLRGIVWLTLGIGGCATGRLYESCGFTDCVIYPGSGCPVLKGKGLFDCIAFCSSLFTCNAFNGFLITSLEKIFLTYAEVVLFNLFTVACPALPN
jgi:hypothetical protein